MITRTMTTEECVSAAAVQAAVDELAAAGGGLLRLPAVDLTLDRGIALRTGVVLEGTGDGTILRKAPLCVYPAAGYHNYGMRDVPLTETTGLVPGMTVSVCDDVRHGSFYETFATITWVEDGWVGLDRGLEADYAADRNPRLVTTFPLVFGLNVRGAGIRNLRLEGNRDANPHAMGGCRGACVYFATSRDIRVENIVQGDYAGEGLGFQMCREVVIRDSVFRGNTGNGLHPGAGSTNVRIENCRSDENERCGFFFCVRATRVTVRNCEFRNNETGISIGTRDCLNRIENCTIEANRGFGLVTRPQDVPCEVHSCLIARCRFAANGKGPVHLDRNTHDLIFAANDFGDAPEPIRRHETVREIALLADVPTDLPYGYDESLPPEAYRHLGA